MVENGEDHYISTLTPEDHIACAVVSKIDDLAIDLLLLLYLNFVPFPHLSHTCNTSVPQMNSLDLVTLVALGRADKGYHHLC